MNPKEAALAHFEKAILGVCVAVLGWYLYSVLSIKPYSRKPDEFTDATTKARTYVQDANRKLPESEAVQLASINFAEQAAKLFKSYVPDDVKDFLHLQRWVRPFDYGVNFRNEPKILAASQPKVQGNRGLMQTYLIDASGNIKKHKVPKSKMKTARKRGGSKMRDMMGSGGEMGKRRGGMESSGGGPPEGMGDLRGGGGGSGGYPGMGDGGGGSEGMGDMMGMGMMGGYPGGGRGGAALGDDLGGGDEGGSAPGGGKFVAKREARNKIIERMSQKDKKDDKKNAKEEEVEEPIESREGYRFVEICATFPHSQQIEEFVKALREPARQVKLQYATLDVERSELTPNFTWSEFKSIPIKEQFDIVSSAIGTVQEGSQALMPGLAMNVPELDVYQREFLHFQFPIYEKVEPAEYTLETLDPVRYENERLAKEREERMRNPNYKRSEKKKDPESEKKYLAERPGGQNLGFRDPNKQKDAKGRVSNRFEVKTALVRYWDFTVEPGRKYKYRVRVKVFNPNYKRTDVADPDSASRILLTGPWSPTSDEVFVDFDNHWYVAEQKRGNRSNELQLEVHHWYRNMGEWLVSTFPQRVGQIVGLADRAKPMKAYAWNDVVHEYEVRDLRPEAFDSGNVLVGLSFGNLDVELFGSSRGIAIPREAVALNPFGDLVRQEEQVDKKDPIRQSVKENYEEIEKSIAGKTGESKKDEEEERPKGKRGGRGGGAGGSSAGGRG